MGGWVGGWVVVCQSTSNTSLWLLLPGLALNAHMISSAHALFFRIKKKSTLLSHCFSVLIALNVAFLHVFSPSSSPYLPSLLFSRVPVSSVTRASGCVSSS